MSTIKGLDSKASDFVRDISRTAIEKIDESAMAQYVETLPQIEDEHFRTLAYGKVSEIAMRRPEYAQYAAKIALHGAEHDPMHNIEHLEHHGTVDRMLDTLLNDMDTRKALSAESFNNFCESVKPENGTEESFHQIRYINKVTVARPDLTDNATPALYKAVLNGNEQTSNLAYLVLKGMALSNQLRLKDGQAKKMFKAAGFTSEDAAQTAANRLQALVAASKQHKRNMNNRPIAGGFRFN